MPAEETTEQLTFAIQIIKSHAGWHEAQLDGAGGTIALFREDDFGDILLVVGHRLSVFRLLVLLFAIDERDQIRVLLERARFAQVRELGAVIGTRLRRTRKLRQSQHGYVQFL